MITISESVFVKYTVCVGVFLQFQNVQKISPELLVRGLSIIPATFVEEDVRVVGEKGPPYHDNHWRITVILCFRFFAPFYNDNWYIYRHFSIDAPEHRKTMRFRFVFLGSNYTV